MNFGALGQTFTVPVNAEIAVSTCQGGDQAGFAPDGGGEEFSIPALQTAALVLGSAVVGADALGDFGGSGVGLLISAGQFAQQGQNEKLGDKVSGHSLLAVGGNAKDDAPAGVGVICQLFGHRADFVDIHLDDLQFLFHAAQPHRLLLEEKLAFARNEQMTDVV